MNAHVLHKQAYLDRVQSQVTSYTVTIYDQFCINCLKSWTEDLEAQPCVKLELKELSRV